MPTGVSFTMKKSSIKVLLNEDLESYYWIGFLLADGTFYNKNNSAGLKLTLNELDKNHLLKFSNFIKAEQKIYYQKNKNGNHYSLTVFNNKVVKEIISKFSIKKRKTYNPPDLSFYKNLSHNHLLLSLIVGIIDGDGCIKFQTRREDCVIAIKMHSSWLDFLIFIQEFLIKITEVSIPLPIINSKGYARLNITNSKVINFLKNFTKVSGLPVLGRKWDRVNEFKISKRENLTKTLELYNNGESIEKIMKTLNIKKRTVYKTLNKNGIYFLKRKEKE